MHIRKFESGDAEYLLHYLNGLGEIMRKRFGPHSFDLSTINTFYTPGNANSAYLGIDELSNQLVAYAIVKKGYLDHDAPRLQSYGLILNPETDTTFAPSIADAWQGKGIGSVLLKHIINDLKSHTPATRMILWGGVQADNHQALKFYAKHGFEVLGPFEYHGMNFDMILDLGR